MRTVMIQRYTISGAVVRCCTSTYALQLQYSLGPGHVRRTLPAASERQPPCGAYGCWQLTLWVVFHIIHAAGATPRCAVAEGPGRAAGHVLAGILAVRRASISRADWVVPLRDKRQHTVLVAAPASGSCLPALGLVTARTWKLRELTSRTSSCPLMFPGLLVYFTPCAALPAVTAGGRPCQAMDLEQACWCWQALLQVVYADSLRCNQIPC
jgi:hypothetical protein